MRQPPDDEGRPFRSGPVTIPSPEITAQGSTPACECPCHLDMDHPELGGCGPHYDWDDDGCCWIACEFCNCPERTDEELAEFVTAAGRIADAMKARQAATIGDLAASEVTS